MNLTVTEWRMFVQQTENVADLNVHLRQWSSPVERVYYETVDEQSQRGKERKETDEE